jgi:hypothetical protein
VSAPGTYTLTVTGPNGCTDSDVVVVNQDITPPTCAINQPAQPPDCGTTGNTLIATTSEAISSLVWSIDPPVTGWSITGGQGTNTITYTAGSSGPATFKLEVTGTNGCQSSCTLPVSCTQPPTAFCTFTQGFYGGRGKFKGETVQEIIQRLITPDSALVIGKKSANRSLTIADGTELCINTRLPAGSTSSKLPSGNNTMQASNCQSIPNALPVKNGKWQNVLLGQTVALSLNVRFDPNLADFKLVPSFCTQGSSGVIMRFTILSPVFKALDELKLPHTVGGLLELANLALAGQPTGDANLTSINNAVDAINRGFDECRTLASCQLAKEVIEYEGEPVTEAPTDYALDVNYPNPFNPRTVIQFSLPKPEAVSLKVYNTFGQEVLTLVDHEIYDAGDYAVTFNASGLASGVYFYRLQAGEFTATKKMLLMR